MNFIKLTKFTNNEKTYINLDLVEAFSKSRNGYTVLNIVNTEESYHIEEDPEEILRLLAKTPYCGSCKGGLNGNTSNTLQ